MTKGSIEEALTLVREVDEGQSGQYQYNRNENNQIILTYNFFSNDENSSLFYENFGYGSQITDAFLESLEASISILDNGGNGANDGRIGSDRTLFQSLAFSDSRTLSDNAQYVATFVPVTLTQSQSDNVNILYGGYNRLARSAGNNNSALFGLAIPGDFEDGSFNRGDIWVFQDGLLSIRSQNTLIHETGHRLGLDDTAEFNQSFTIMTREFNLDRTSGLAAEYQLYDVAALQYLHGVSADGTSGNTSYTYSDNDNKTGINSDFVEFGVPVSLSREGDRARVRTIYDHDGIDVIDASGSSQSAYIDLRPGHFSSIGLNAGVIVSVDGDGDFEIEDIGVQNASIAFGSYIENATGSSANDILIGNLLDNELRGGDGNDLIFAEGNSVSSFQGFFGNLFSDLESGDGDHSIIDQGSVSEANIDAFNQKDRLFGGAGDDKLFGSRGDDELFGGEGADEFFGGSGDDRIFALIGDTVVNGGDGYDSIDYSNSDIAVSLGSIRESLEIDSIEEIVGSDFDDRFILDRTIIFSDEELDIDGGGGADFIVGNGSDNNLLGGTGDDVIIGGDGDENIEGGADTDTLFGLEGDDTIIGGAGDDTLFGGDGDDVIYGDGTIVGDDIISVNDGTTTNFLFGGDGNDEIHLGYNDFAVGGKGADSFYVTTEIDDNSFDFKSVFLLDFVAGEDKLFVNGVEFDGFRKTITNIRPVIDSTPPNFDDFPTVFIEESGVSSYGLNLLQGRATPEAGQSFGNFTPPLSDGAYRDIRVSAGLEDLNFGKITFVNANLSFSFTPGPLTAGPALATNVSEYLNIYTRPVDVSDTNSIFERESVFPDAFGNARPYELVDERLGLDISNVDQLIPNSSRLNISPDQLTTEVLTGFNADGAFFDQGSFDRDVDEARAGRLVSAGSGDDSGIPAGPVIPVEVVTSVGTLSTLSALVSPVAPLITNVTLIPAADDMPIPSRISFRYDDLLTIDVPVAAEEIQFVAFEGLLNSTALSENRVTAFGNALSLSVLGIVPDDSELFSVDISKVIFGGDDSDEFIGQNGDNIFIGNDDDDIATLVTSDEFSSSLLVGGTGDDQYILTGEQGAFSNIVIAERLSGDEISSGNDILSINADSTDVIISRVEGTNNIRILVPQLDTENQGTIDIINQLGSDSDDYIEEYHFSDGVILSREELLTSITIENNAPTVSETLSDVSSAEDTAIDIALPADAFADVDGDALTLSASLSDGNDLPAWLSFDGGRFFGTPPQDFNGVLDLRVTASDGELSTDNDFTLSIDPVNDAPIVLAPLADISSAEDTAIDIALPADAFSDVDGDALTLSASLSDGSELPAWFSFDGARFFGTPPTDFNGVLDLRVTASDGELSTDNDFTLSIDPVNDAPIVLAPLADISSAEDTAIDIALPADAFSDVDGDALTLSASLSDGNDLPAWLSFDGGRFFGTPPQDFNGVLDLRVTASDGELSTDNDFTLSIDPVNDAPVVLTALSDVSSAEDTAIDIALPADAFSDVDGDALTLSASLSDGSELPAWLQFDGSRFFGTPPTDFNGVLDLRVTASDGELSTNNDFTLSIDPVNDAPIVLAPLADISSAEDTAFAITLPDNIFADVDGDVLTLSARLSDGSGLPSWVQFDGLRFFGTPPQDFNGVLEIEVSASDDELSVTDSFTLTIDPVNDAPISVDDDTFLSEGSNELTITQEDLLLNDIDVDGDTLEVIEVANGQNGTVDFDTDGNIIYKPNSGFFGSDSFQYTISDGISTSTGTAQVRIDNLFAGFRQGTERRDFLFGNFFRQNRIFGRGGNDIIFGGFRNDQLAGGTGNDRIFGRFGNDDLYGNEGDDLLFGGRGTDTAHFAGLSTDYELTTSFGGFFIRTRDEEPSINGDDGRDQLFSIERLAFADRTISVTSPIVLDLDGDGIELISASQSNALFDLDGDGVRDDTSWIGSGDAFLFIDRDGNNTVSGVNEISFIDDAQKARSDLDGLRSFDSNSDGILSSDDDQFAEFGVWQDLNGDGIVDEGEIFTLPDAGVVSINLNAVATDEDFSFGDVAIVNQGEFTRDDGTTSGFADAAITFFEQGVRDLPDIEFGRETFSRKSKKYRLFSKNGELSIGSKKGDDRIDLTGASILEFRNRNIGLLSVLAIDLDGDGIELRDGAKSDALFDADGNGARDDTGWVVRGDGFLVIDRNDNGLIDNGSELNFLTEAANARNGLQALSILDSNGDGIVSSQDVRFRELRVWVDRNENGITDIGELSSLEDLGITSINLAGQAVADRVKVGKNIILATSTFTRTDGSTGQIGDAVLSFTPENTPQPVFSNTTRNSLLENFNEVDLSIASLELESDDPRLSALRRGLNGSAGFNRPNLGFDIPQGVSIFDYFEQSSLGGIVSDNSNPLLSATQSSPSSTANRNAQYSTSIEAVGDDFTDIVSSVAASTSTEDVSSNDEPSVTSLYNIEQEALTEDAALLLVPNNGDTASVTASDTQVGPAAIADVVVQSNNGVGVGNVDPDVLRLAMITQDMNSFGVKSSAESNLKRNTELNSLDYFAV